MNDLAPAVPRLGTATLRQARSGLRLPAYDRTRLEPGIVHLGLGAFVRAHALLYTEDVLAESAGPWGFRGASLRSAEQRDRLAPQEFLYTAIERGREGSRARIVGALRDIIVPGEDPEPLLAALAAPETRIVSLTITEKGYGHDPASGALDAQHPDVQHDLASPQRPRGAVGLLVAALARRRDAGLAPFTVLCCDNLPRNGRLVSGLVTDFASLVDGALASWITRNVSFPSTMVDRIVPAATEGDRAAAAHLTGLFDAAPVAHEPFRQWVIEDQFVAGRPEWERAGAEIVGDVLPFEHMKLRMLNGAHSALAYLGLLAGISHISEAVAEPVLRAYVRRLWQAEIIPVLPPPPGTDLSAYADALLARFENPGVRHRTEQIAMDGSQKLPQRLLATIRERLQRNLPVACLAHAVAAWMIHLEGRDELGQEISPSDPMLAQLRRALASAGPGAAEKVWALGSVRAVFGDLGTDPRFLGAVRSAHQALTTRGVRPTLRALVEGA